MRRVADQDWRLVSNCHGGVHRTPGASAAEAKAVVRAGIAEAFESEGPSAREARRAASGYLVRMVAGPASCDEVVEAFVAWTPRTPTMPIWSPQNSQPRSVSDLSARFPADTAATPASAGDPHR
jgi:hypothetical protein